MGGISFRPPTMHSVIMEMYSCKVPHRLPDEVARSSQQSAAWQLRYLPPSPACCFRYALGVTPYSSANTRLNVRWDSNPHS